MCPGSDLKNETVKTSVGSGDDKSQLRMECMTTLGPTWQWTDALLNTNTLSLNLRELEDLDCASHTGHGLRARFTDDYNSVVATPLTHLVYKLE